jgi:hypothetical protein
MKLRNILITAAAMGFMFASMDRTGVVGYTAGDYADMNTYPHMASGQNVAWTNGSGFNAFWTDGGTTWGFSGGSADELVNMNWANGSMGVAFGLAMPPGGDTTMDIGFGMNFAGFDVGFNMNTGDDMPMYINARGGCGFWAFDTVTVGVVNQTDYMTLGVNMYGVHEWGPATGMFGLGFKNTDQGGVYGSWSDDVVPVWTETWGALSTDSATLISTNFSVESTLTDWCDLRVGYSKTFNMTAETGVGSTDSFSAGLGFNYGSCQLDMTLADDALGMMMDNPLHYVNGRNTNGLTQSWTLSYTW